MNWGAALQDLLTMCNEHFPGSVPATSWSLWIIWPVCGEIACEDQQNQVRSAPRFCSSRKAEFDIEKRPKVRSYFLPSQGFWELLRFSGTSGWNLWREEAPLGVTWWSSDGCGRSKWSPSDADAVNSSVQVTRPPVNVVTNKQWNHFIFNVSTRKLFEKHNR